jgi:hypothetical protein
VAKIPGGLKFNKDGLIPAIAQHARTGQVLMMAYMNRAALRMTLDSGFAHLLQPVPGSTLEERRRVRTSAAGSRGPPRLRW